jgi:hypothetical protein
MNRIIGLTAFAALFIVFSPSGLHAQDFGGGSGTAADPWQVHTGEHLNNVRNYLGPAHGDKHFRLTNDIDLTDEFLPGGQFYNGGQGWLPIGVSSSDHFAGNFDGGGNSIIGLFINRTSDYQGLFGYVVDSRIENTAVEDVDVTGRNIVGALVGYNRGTVDGSRSSGIVKGGYRVGGLVGENNPGAVQNSSSSATVDANDGRIGGLVGFNVGGAVECSFATGQVSGGWYAGGLVGRNLEGLVNQSYATGAVYSASVTGGLVGDTEGGSISDSYATGAAVAGNWFGGGLIGYLWSTAVSNSFSTGPVSGGEDIGGLVGYKLGGSVSNSYWNTETSGQMISAGGLGRTTAEMTYPHSANTYVGWDFAAIWQEDVHYANNSGYPFLSWQDQDVTGVDLPLPHQVSLANFPNPFNPATTISFCIASDGHVTLSVFNIRGELVATLINGNRQAGDHHVTWEGTGPQGRRVPGGVYLYRVVSNGGTLTRKMTLLR